MNDYPPKRDGKDPLHKLETYLKELRGWLHTTRTAPQLRGWAIFRQSKDDLKRISNDIKEEDV